MFGVQGSRGEVRIGQRRISEPCYISLRDGNALVDWPARFFRRPDDGEGMMLVLDNNPSPLRTCSRTAPKLESRHFTPITPIPSTKPTSSPKCPCLNWYRMRTLLKRFTANPRANPEPEHELDPKPHPNASKHKITKQSQMSTFPNKLNNLSC
jgi:hypothetical protein